MKQVTETKQWHELWRTISLTFIIATMLPEIVQKEMLLNLCNFKVTPWNALFSCILMNFHSSSHKTSYRNKTMTWKLLKTSFFDFHNCIHVTRKNSQDTFQFMEIKNKPWKTLFSFIFLMIFYSSSPKTDCQNKNTTSKLWENSLFDIL